MTFNIDHGDLFPNDESHSAGFQDDNEMYHWSDGHALNDGSNPPLDLQFGTPFSDMHGYDIVSGSDQNNNHDDMENNVAANDQSVTDHHNNDNSTKSEESTDTSNCSKDNKHSKDISFGSYYYTGANGEKLYHCDDGHVYDVDGIRVK